MSFLRGLRILSLLCLCLAPVTAQQEDEFNSPVLGSQWSWVRENPNRWSLTGFELEIRTEPGALNGLPSYIPATNSQKNILLQSAPDVTFRMETRLTFHPDSSYQGAGLMYYMDDDNYVLVSRGVYNLFNGVWLEWEVGGSTGIRLLDQVSAGTIWLRLSRTNNPYGNQYTGTYSLDGVAWKLIGMEQIVFSGSLPQPRIGLQASDGVGASVSTASIPARFDYFHFALTGIEPDAAVSTPFCVTGMYPNPVSARLGCLHLRVQTLAPAEVTVTMFDPAGRKIARTRHETVSGLSDLPVSLVEIRRGIYFLLIESDREKVFRSLLIE